MRIAARAVMVRVVRVSRGDATDVMRSAGGILLAAGAVVLFARKSGHHGWGGFALLLVVLIPAVVLYLLGLGISYRQDRQRPRPWQSLVTVAAILLWPVALLQFLVWVGARTTHLYLAGVFVVTGLLAAYASRSGRVRYAALLAGLSSLVVWFYVWEKILPHASADTARWLIVAAGALLLTAAAGLARAKAIGAGEVATAGGIAAVGAGMFGVIVGGVLAALNPLITLGQTAEGAAVTSANQRLRSFRPAEAQGMPRAIRNVQPHTLVLHRAVSTRGLPSGHAIAPFHSLAHVAHTSGLQHVGWDIYLLAISVALICGAGLWRMRGLGYVGGIGLLAFIISVATQLTRVEVGRAPTGSIVGWPLALIVVGVVGLVAPALYRRGT